MWIPGIGPRKSESVGSGDLASIQGAQTRHPKASVLRAGARTCRVSGSLLQMHQACPRQVPRDLHVNKIPRPRRSPYLGFPTHKMQGCGRQFGSGVWCLPALSPPHPFSDSRR